MAPRISFLELPAEIRNQIYVAHLCQDEPILLPYAYESKAFAEPALLSAHPAIWNEAAPIYYGCNVFETPSPAAANRFLHQLDRQRISWLRQVRPLDLVTCENRWELMRTNLNKLVESAGKGCLRPEAVQIPIRGMWFAVEDVADFEVKSKENGGWSVEWRD